MVNSALLHKAEIDCFTMMHMVTEKAPTLETVLQVRASASERQATAKTFESPPHYIRTTAPMFCYDRHQWREHCRSTSQSRYTPVYYMSSTIKP